MLEIKNLDVKYGQISALKGISMTVETGKLTTIIGANGSGKSTLLKTISGLMQPGFRRDHLSGEGDHPAAERRNRQAGNLPVPRGPEGAPASDGI